MPSSRTTVARGLAASIIIGSLVGGVAPSVVNRLIPGSSVTQGDVVLVTTNQQNSSLSNVNPSLFVNSGAALTFGTSTTGGDIPGGGVRFQSSGTTMMVANWLVPAKYASGAVLESAWVECGGIPNTTSGSIVANQPRLKASITTGNQIRNNISLSSGVSAAYVASGTVLNKLQASTYLSFITNPKATTGTGSCVFKPRVHEKFGK